MPSDDSWDRPPAPPRPGSAEIAGGFAPAGFVNRCAPPLSGTVRGPLSRPGYASPLAPRNRAAPSVESTPPVRVTRKAGPVSTPFPSFR